jgi:hypothetical protein
MGPTGYGSVELPVYDPPRSEGKEHERRRPALAGAHLVAIGFCLVLGIILGSALLEGSVEFGRED